MDSFRERLRTLFLGADPRQQMPVSQSLLVLVIYLVFAVGQHAEVRMGLIDEAASWHLTAWNLAGGFGFYAVLRSGLARRLGGSRALSIPQSLWAMAGISWSYAITGPARGSVILIMVLILNFGMFSLQPRQARALAGAALGLLGGVMLFKALTDPAHYDPRVEAIHFAFTAIVLASASALAVRIGRLRARLQDQRSELAGALERIQALATCDELTGLTNRRAAMERMRQELALRARPLPRMSLALLDLDHFKRINDGHGHAAGDQVLRRFSEVLGATVREGDLPARWGGEEFLLVMPATPGDEAMRALERLRQALRAREWADVAPGLQVSFSAGVAECEGAADLEAAIERADKALYAAKHAGRDRSVWAGPPQPLAASVPAAATA